MRLVGKIEHKDHTYILERGGHVLYSYMRQAASRTTYRRQAVQRAHDRYRRALDDAHSDLSVGGLGLIVVQRAFLAAEDLGLLLHALDEPPSWARFTAARLPDLDAVYRRVLSDHRWALKPFMLPSERAEIEEASDLEGDGLWRLAQLSAARRLQQLQTAAGLWQGVRPVVKSTMHGFPFVAGSLVFGPPPAGALTNGVAEPVERPWALAVQSTFDRRARHVASELIAVPLDSSYIAASARAGKAAASVARDLCGMQTATIEGVRAHAIPLDLLRRLPVDQQAAIEAHEDDG